jgi:endonuclease/exonuclease/phosphatase family metal-dependent hydrolase
MQRRSEVIVYGIVFLFFFQLISEFVEAIYAFGLLGTGIPVEILSVLFLFSPFILLLLPGRPSGRWLAVAGSIALVAGTAGMLLDTRGRMFATGIGTAAFLIYFPALLADIAQTRDREAAPRLGGGLTAGLALFIFFRALNSGVYPYDHLWFKVAAGVISAVGLWILFALAEPQKDSGHQQMPEVRHPKAGTARAALLSIAVVSALTLLYFAFSSPNVMARWSGVNYGLVLGATAAAIGLFVIGLVVRPVRETMFEPSILAVWNVVFLAAMMAAILPHQIGFPANPESYPLAEPAAVILAIPALILTALLFPVILVDFMVLIHSLFQINPGLKKMGAAFGAGSVFMILMIFGQVFTTVYDYIPVVGPFFRDRFWLIFLILGLALTLPLLLVRKNSRLHQAALPWSAAAAIVILATAALSGAGLTAARPQPPEGTRNDLRVLTYNIQQGYSEDGSRNPHRQLALMKDLNADIIGLQESDTNRIAGGNSDVVRYMADQLDMYSYYGPKVIPGTFGIALLSRYPIENPRTFYMYSEREQTATIHAQINVGGRLFNVYVTHLGNGGPIVQQENLLQELGGMENIVLMGDFNFRPDTPQYELTKRRLEDAWLVKWPSGVNDEGYNPERRIDHIFLSPGINVREAIFLTGPESDHPALLVELEW